MAIRAHLFCLLRCCCLLLCCARLLELTGAKEPAALEKLVKAVGVKPAAVNKDLLLYKGVLSKLSAAKVGRGRGDDCRLGLLLSDWLGRLGCVYCAGRQA
jgi:hypothetical protein